MTRHDCPSLDGKGHRLVGSEAPPRAGPLPPRLLFTPLGGASLWGQRRNQGAYSLFPMRAIPLSRGGMAQPTEPRSSPPSSGAHHFQPARRRWPKAGEKVLVPACQAAPAKSGVWKDDGARGPYSTVDALVAGHRRTAISGEHPITHRNEPLRPVWPSVWDGVCSPSG
jgi:hypothetical protein